MSEIDYPSERQVEIADILRVTKRQQTLAGILVAVLIHVLLGFVLALIVLPQLAPAPPELIISAVSSVGAFSIFVEKLDPFLKLYIY